ncbi:hypothetical protein HOY34_12705 [Xinfangfangia sp. D13-10-4-6]|uniref:hypothetical protein n=1 Tax=Pseudogemmobacter hezensis TaxID=2737662 RepID=UPI001556116B|nr:hypothetical protein [Pseudogemmobacter hezensis]NPD16060.1 hypothetical protein [Pseudogemmobacter hezensis]
MNFSSGRLSWQMPDWQMSESAGNPFDPGLPRGGEDHSPLVSFASCTLPGPQRKFFIDKTHKCAMQVNMFFMENRHPLVASPK